MDNAASPSIDSLAQRAAMDRRFIDLYPQLRRLARSRLQRERTLTLLGTTALVHESYFRLMGHAKLALAEQPAFLAYASHVMRHLIVDYARARVTQRRGERAEHVPIDDFADLLESGTPEHEILQVHEAVSELARAEPRLARVVEMRYFAGMTEPEIGLALGLSERTVRRDDDKARRLLQVLMS